MEREKGRGQLCVVHVEPGPVRHHQSHQRHLLRARLADWHIPESLRFSRNPLV